MTPGPEPARDNAPTRAPEAPRRTNRPTTPPVRLVPPTPYSTVPGSTGRPLPEHVARTIGERLGVDLSAVRVYDDALANKAAAQRSVRAFAYGTDIYLGSGEQATDVELMAHEVAHVIQQAGRPTLQLFTVPAAPDALEHEAQAAGAAVARGQSTTVTGRTAPREQGGVLSWIGDRLEDIADWAEDRFWDLVDSLLPDWLAAIIRKGLFTWLKEKITAVAQAAFDALMAPVRMVAGFIESVTEHFKNLVDWMRDAVAKLLRGDCSSIADAAEKIWRVVEGIGMAIVNKVKDVVGAVAGFFKGIWDKYISKAWDWMATVVSSAARAVWDTIKRVGEFLWDLTKPVRDIAGRVWRWLKRQIFGDETGGSDGKGGLLEWVKSKAEAAWDWLKEKLEPIKVPLAVIGGIVVALSPAGPVIAIGAVVYGLVKGAQWIGAKLRDRNSVIRERGYLRGVILPRIMGAVNAVWSAVSRAAGSLARIFGAAVSGLGSAVTGLASSIFRFLSPLVGWILNLFKRIFAWASEAVGGLAALLRRGFDRLMAFLQPLFDVVGALASVISDLLNIVKLIFLKAWHLIPACIRDPIVNFIRDQILKRIPIFSQLLEIPDIWTKVKETAFAIIRQIFRDGDIWGAAKTFFRAVLSILNIPLELVTGIFTKAWGAIDSIIRSPIRFLRSVLGAMWQGFGQFFKKILKYLLEGVLGWLTSQLKDAGIEAPTEWTFGALVKLVLSVLGVTLEKLWKLLGRKIGDPIVEKLKKAVKMLTGAWEWVAALISEGPVGLWKKLKEEVSQLKDLVIDAISGYLQSTIIGEASKKILTSLNPAGAIINAIILAYNAIKTAAQYARQILEMVSKVLDAAADLAAGSVGAAANTIEWALGKALTVAIGFLANYLNLGGFGKKVADMVKKIQDRVEKAIEKIIDWAINAGRALLETLGLGKKGEKEKPADVKARAGMLVGERVGGEHSEDEIKTALKKIFEELRPEGLSGLELGPANEEGDRQILASASNAVPVANAAPPKSKNVVMTTTIKLALGPADDLVSMVGRVGEYGQVPLRRGRKEIGAVEAASVTDVPSSQGRAGAFVIKPKSGDTELKVVSWRTGQPVWATNDSHAERQFQTWWESQTALHERIEEITLEINKSPCGLCVESVRAILVNVAKGGVLLTTLARSGKITATLKYSSLHTGKNATTRQDIGDLEAAGWKVFGETPKIAQREPPPELEVVSAASRRGRW
jgi:phage-related protein